MTSAADLSDRAREFLAYGGQHRALLRPLYEGEQGVWPEFVQEAHGYELVGADGRSFVDWMSAYGAVLLGYGNPEVEEAVTAQLRSGPLTPLMDTVEVEVAELLVEMIPCAEMVAFGKNGSDVTTAAVRVARAATGRELILQFGFHGFHDWYTCQYRSQNAQGIPKVLRSFVHSFPYHDLEELERLFNRYPGEVAAVVMEPVTLSMPEPGYLESVRQLTAEQGALLVFDELVTGFRLANGGAQEFFGVTPDLGCFGKALANGMPLAAIVGKREYMQHLPRTAWGMTFRGETLSLAAARAVLNILREKPVTEHIARIGSKLREGLQQVSAAEGIHCDLVGPPARMTISFDDAAGIDPQRIETLFLLECARNGVLTHGALFPTYAHDDDAVQRTLDAFRVALGEVRKAAESRRQVSHRAVLAGFAAERSAAKVPGNGQVGSVPNGALDAVRDTGSALEVRGWLLLEDGAPDSVEFLASGGAAASAELHARPDVVELFPDVPAAEICGFAATLRAAVFARDGAYEFTILASRNGRAAFRCPVRRRAAGEALTAAELGEDGVLLL